MRKIYFLLRFFEEESYVESFRQGHIYMNRLSYFRGSEEHSGDLIRADRNEGVSAWLQPDRGRLTINERDITDDLVGPIEIYSDGLDHLHVFCVYAVHSDNLDLESFHTGEVDAFKQQAKVHEDCLRFGRHVVVVKNVSEFFRRIESAAKTEGYQFQRGLVKYYDPDTFHGWFPPEKAVFMKQIKYQHHEEYRFVIDTGRSGIEPLTLKIGDIHDITFRINTVDLNEALMNMRVEITF